MVTTPIKYSLQNIPVPLGNSLKVHAIDGGGWDATGLSAPAALQTKFKANFEQRPGTS